MKELSIEEKQKTYDEAIRKLRGMMPNWERLSYNGKTFLQDLIYIFPELKESEDERIRKRIILCLEECVHDDIIRDYEKDECLAWLEKQGTPKQVSIWKHWKDGIAGNGEGKPIFLIKDGGTYRISSVLGFECDYIELSELDNLMLEKQGYTDGIIEKAKTEKQRVIITETSGNANIDWDTRSLADTKMLLEYGLGFINKKFEKEGEQKYADKVEPKFHEGEWVVLTAGELSTTLQIVKVDTNKRLYWFNDNSYLPIVDEECLYLWTIQDAKDGDVLVASDGSIFLFAGVDDCACKYYVALTTDSYIKINKEGGYWETSRATYPATKDQRDLLFQKMHEAGYMWDSKSKQLLSLKAEPSGKQKPSKWSEEDKVMLDEIIDFFENGTVKLQHDLSLYASWLKSLKERYTWKPSKEQLKFLQHYADQNSYDGTVLTSLLNDLKKL